MISKANARIEVFWALGSLGPRKPRAWVKGYLSWAASGDLGSDPLFSASGLVQKRPFKGPLEASSGRAHLSSGLRQARGKARRPRESWREGASAPSYSTVGSLGLLALPLAFPWPSPGPHGTFSNHVEMSSVKGL